MFQILILNLGSTSTKISFYEDELLTREQTFRLTDEEMSRAATQKAQIALRKGQILTWLDKENLTLGHLDAAVIRVVGVSRCIHSGTYEVNGTIRRDIYGYYNPDKGFLHAGTMTLPLLEELLGDYRIPIYFVDPITVDEFSDEARISGHPLIERKSTFHALNHKAVARSAAMDLGMQYGQANLAVAHLGGGVSIAAHHLGRVVDASNCGKGDTGPFSPNRSGDLPTWPLVELCFSGKYTKAELESMFLTAGGFAAYLGVTDGRTVEEMAQGGDEKADLVLRAFIYQVSKEIAAQCAVLGFGNVDGIVLTGGLAFSKRIVDGIRDRLGAVAPVLVYAGEKEAEAMVAGALRVLRHEEDAILM